MIDFLLLLGLFGISGTAASSTADDDHPPVDDRDADDRATDTTNIDLIDMLPATSLENSVDAPEPETAAQEGAAQPPLSESDPLSETPAADDAPPQAPLVASAVSASYDSTFIANNPDHFENHLNPPDTDGNDTIVGATAGPNLYGNYGDDLMVNLPGGRDAVHGGIGNDFLVSERGYDSLYGGEGDDTIVASGQSQRIEGHTGNDQIYAGGNMAWVHGDHGDDTLIGGQGVDWLKGGGDNDLIYSVDYVDPANGFEEYAADRVRGGHGDDTIIAGRADEVRGGAGADVIATGTWIASKSFSYYDSEAGFYRSGFVDDTTVDPSATNYRIAANQWVTVGDFDPSEDMLHYIVPHDYDGPGDITIEQRSTGSTDALVTIDGVEAFNVRGAAGILTVDMVQIVTADASGDMNLGLGMPYVFPIPLSPFATGQDNTGTDGETPTDETDTTPELDPRLDLNGFGAAFFSQNVDLFDIDGDLGDGKLVNGTDENDHIVALSSYADYGPHSGVISDVINAMAGDDVVVVVENHVDSRDVDIRVDAGDGNDLVLSIERSSYSDIPSFFTGGGGDDTLLNGTDMLGGQGNDVIIGGLDARVLAGGDGDDALLAYSNAVLLGGSGDDFIVGLTELDDRFSSIVNDNSEFEQWWNDDQYSDFAHTGPDAHTANEIIAGDGDDTIIAGSGDTITGGDGHDDIVAGTWVGAGVPSTYEWRTEEYGEFAHVTVTDFEPNEDMLYITMPSFYDGAGDITFEPSGIGGLDRTVLLDDKAFFTVQGVGDTLTLDMVRIVVADPGAFAGPETPYDGPIPIGPATGYETFLGPEYANLNASFVNSFEAEVTTGSSDVDVILGGNGRVLAEDGDDVIVGLHRHFGANTGDTYGGGGDDIVLARGYPGSHYGDDGNDIIRANVAFGGAGDDVLKATWLGEYLDGGTGDDSVMGAWGPSDLIGGEGDDVIVGYFYDVMGTGPAWDRYPDVVQEPRNQELAEAQDQGFSSRFSDADVFDPDVLYGGEGSDLLIAGSGDTVVGGAGADLIVAGTWVGAEELQTVVNVFPEPGPHHVTVADFAPDEDHLYIYVPSDYAGAGEISFTPVSGADMDMIVALDGQDIFTVNGVGETLTANMVTMVVTNPGAFVET